MNVELELNSILELERTARIMVKQVSGLRSSYSIAAPATDQEFVSHSQGTDPIGKFVSAIDEAERRLDEVIDRLVDLKRKMNDLINLLPDYQERLFLSERYIAIMDTEAIANENGVSRRWVNEVLRSARKHLQTVADEKNFITSSEFPKVPHNVC
jgi:DNA-directed RNA polymerase specialized sigma24 family protein